MRFLGKPSDAPARKGSRVTETTLSPSATAELQARRHHAVAMIFFLLAAAALLLRFCVSPALMNMVVEYTTIEGSFYEKLHFGTYAIFALLPFALFARPVVLRGREIPLFRHLVRFCALMTLLIVFLAFTGRASSSGFVIDTYLMTGVAALLLLSLGPDTRGALADVTLIMLIVSAVVGIGEAVTETRLLPYPLTELVFRPTGLSEHPLALGALCATGIAFATLARWPIWVRLAAVAVLFIGCAASGARLALLVAAAEVVLLLLFVPWPGLSPRHERQAKLVTLIFTVGMGIALIGILAGGGLLSRFSESIFDENFMARITVYEVFSHVSPAEIIFGKNLESVIEIVQTELKLPTIEATPVVIVFLFGLPLALVFTWIIGRLLLQLLRGAPVAATIGTITFLLAALSNNTLSTKTPVFCILVVLLMGYALPRRVEGRANQSTTS